MMRVNFALLGWRVSLSVRRQAHYTAAQIDELVRSGQMIFCTSRCLYCGRQTPHEVCHAHSERTNPGWSESGGYEIDDALWDSGQEPETCSDPECPAWEPEEAAQLRESRRIAEVVG